MKNMLFLLFGIFFGTSVSQPIAGAQEDFPSTVIQYQKGEITNIKTENQDGFGSNQEVDVKILSGPEKGEIVHSSYQIIGDLLPPFHIGSKVLLYTEHGFDSVRYYVRDLWRSDVLFLWFFIFLVSAVFVIGKRGIRGLLALMLSILTLFFIFFPLIFSGLDPIIGLFLITLLLITINVPLVHGWNKKAGVIALATFLSILLSLILTFIVNWSLSINGMGMEETLYLGQLLSFEMLPKLFSTGVILGAIGAILDVCVSITTGIQEICAHSQPDKKKLFHSGMNIGTDIFGSMLNTLIFAYAGSSMILLLLLYDMDSSLTEMLNFSYLVEEIVRSLIGAFGLLISIPIAAQFSALVFGKKD